jgi:hypothetical protein
MHERTEARIAWWLQPLAPVAAFLFVAALGFAGHVEILAWVSTGLVAGYSLSGST